MGVVSTARLAYLVGMDKQTTRQVVTALVRAGRKDLAVKYVTTTPKLCVSAGTAVYDNKRIQEVLALVKAKAKAKRRKQILVWFDQDPDYWKQLAVYWFKKIAHAPRLTDYTDDEINHMIADSMLQKQPLL